jgi:uncharacterized protein involved in exopolysaccharide biosynthesis
VDYQRPAQDVVDAVLAPAPPVVAQSGADTVSTSSVSVQLAAARTRLASLEQRYTADHPDVVRGRRQVTDLERRLADEARAAESRDSSAPAPAAVAVDANELARRERIRGMAAEIESLDRQIAFKESEERRVRGEIAEYQRRIEAVPRLESAWVKLTRDYDTQQLAYRDLLTKSNNAQVAANLEDQDIGERFRIVDPANVPVKPLKSKRLLYNAAGLALGLLLGLGVAGFLEFKDQSFWTESDVLDVLAMPVLVSVPYVATEAEKNRSRKRQLLASVSGVVCLAMAGYVVWSLQLWKTLR